jgi:hypothetical protein
MGNRKTDFSNATMCHGRPTRTIQIKSRQLLLKPGRNQYVNLIKVGRENNINTELIDKGMSIHQKSNVKIAAKQKSKMKPGQLEYCTVCGNFAWYS